MTSAGNDSNNGAGSNSDGNGEKTTTNKGKGNGEEENSSTSKYIAKLQLAVVFLWKTMRNCLQVLYKLLGTIILALKSSLLPNQPMQIH